MSLFLAASCHFPGPEEVYGRKKSQAAAPALLWDLIPESPVSVLQKCLAGTTVGKSTAEEARELPSVPG